MGYIREPKGIDFTIQSPPLTDKERKEISEFIQTRKADKKKAKRRTSSVKIQTEQ